MTHIAMICVSNCTFHSCPHGCKSRTICSACLVCAWRDPGLDGSRSNTMADWAAAAAAWAQSGEGEKNAFVPPPPPTPKPHQHQQQHQQQGWGGEAAHEQHVPWQNHHQQHIANAPATSQNYGQYLHPGSDPMMMQQHHGDAQATFGHAGRRRLSQEQHAHV